MGTSLDQGGAFNHGRRILPHRPREQPGDLIHGNMTPVGHRLNHRQMTPLERFEAEDVTKQPFSFTRVCARDDDKIGDKNGAQDAKAAGRQNKRPKLSATPRKTPRASG